MTPAFTRSAYTVIASVMAGLSFRLTAPSSVNMEAPQLWTMIRIQSPEPAWVQNTGLPVFSLMSLPILWSMFWAK